MSTLEQILAWLDAVPARNLTLAYACFTATVGFAWWPLRQAARASWTNSGWLFALAVFATLCAFRWQIWFVSYELNPDESQMIAGARTLLDYPVFWKYVDGTTHGPLVDYFLTTLGWCGLPLNYLTARFAATLLLALTLFGLWGFLRRLVSEGAARLAILPGVAFWSFGWWPDYTHYSSELVPIALIGGALVCFGESLLAGPLDRRTAALFGAAGGFLLGCAPFAKLQLTFIALLIGVAGTVGLVLRRQEAGAGRVLAATMAGALAPAIAVAVFLGIFGLYGQFHATYLLNNLRYVSVRPEGLLDMFSSFFVMISHGQSYPWFLVPAVMYGCWQTQRVFAAADPRERGVILVGWGAVAVAFYSVIVPGRLFDHYLQILVLPATAIAGLHAALSVDRAPTRKAAALAAVVFLGVTVAPQILRQVTCVNPFVGRFPTFRSAPLLGESAYVRRHAQPGDRLAIWGWKSQIWVETGLPQGTREAHTEYQIRSGPMQHFYRVRYLADMEKRRPEWFLDAVGPEAFAFGDRKLEGHESYPPLGAFVRANYELLADIGTTRIYRLKERAAAGFSDLAQREGPPYQGGFP